MQDDSQDDYRHGSFKDVLWMERMVYRDDETTGMTKDTLQDAVRDLSG